MELVKQNENVQKEYDSKGKVKEEKVQSVNYQLTQDGTVVGNANIYNGGFSLNVNNLSGKTISEIQTTVENLFKVETT